MELLQAFGFIPSDQRLLLVIPIVFALWLLFWPFAKLKDITIFYNASLQVSFWEEMLFRGFILGGILYYTKSGVVALVLSSLLFGLFHFRNLWWAGFPRALNNVIYTGLIVGPLFALVRLTTDSIYLGILLHFLHNLFVMLVPRFIYGNAAPTPTNKELREKQIAHRHH